MKHFSFNFKWLVLSLLLCIGSSAWATDVASFSRSGSSNTTTGGTFDATFTGKSGYYQDNTGTCYLQILNNSAYWTTTPSSITLTSSIGGGSGNQDLSNAVYAVLLDSNGDEISSTATSITSHITTAGGDTYNNTSIPVANNVYGIRIYHTKETGYNVRYYSFTLSYEASSGPVTYSVSYNDNGATSGTVPTDATAYSSGDEVTVLGNTGSLAKDHYSFGGWNTQDDGEGTNYVAGDKFNITANTTLYAKWVINSHTVTLPATDAFGEYTMNKTNDVAYGTEVTLTYTPASGYENYVATWSVNGTPISGNKFNMPDAAVTITVNLAEIFDMTLSNGDIVAAGDAAESYDDYEIEDTNGKTWNAYAIKKAHSGATSSYHFLQIKKYASSTAYYIQVPEYGRKITKLEMTVSGSNKPMTDGGNGATLFFSASNSTSATGTGVASGTGASKVTIDCSDLDLNTGYITAGGAVRIWDVKVTYDPIRLNSSGYATYAGLTPIDYSDDSKFSAWAITSISDDAITFSQITGSVPAGTGVLLKGAAGQAVEPVVAASGTALATNLLVGTTTPTAVTAGAVYGLSGNTFVKSSVDGTIPAGKAYILASSIPSTVKSLNFIFDDATGISTLERVVLDNEAWYDLQGRRVAQPTKGIYIHNGKKVFVK